MRPKCVIAETGYRNGMDDLNDVIEQVWRDLDGQVPQARIRQVAVGVAAKFHDAIVTTHIPLFIRHLTREWLKQEIKRHDMTLRTAFHPASSASSLNPDVDPEQAADPEAFPG